jgi:hypothetical protein
MKVVRLNVRFFTLYLFFVDKKNEENKTGMLRLKRRYKMMVKSKGEFLRYYDPNGHYKELKN